MPLPEHVRVVRAKGKTYYYYQRFRNTGRAEKPVRLPDISDLAAFWRKIKELDGPPPPPPPKGRMSEMIAAYIDSAEFDALKPETQRDYQRYLTFFDRIAGQFDPREIQSSHIAGLKDRFKKKAPTYNHLHSVLKTLWKWGIERDWAVVNPVLSVARMKVQSDGHKPWPAWAWELAMTHLRRECRDACILGRYTGQRLRDVLAMDLTKVEDGGITVVQSKTGKGLFVPLHSAVLPVIEEARRRGHMRLVAKNTGLPYTTLQFQAMWTREMAKEPLARIRREGFSFHGLRKTITNEIFESGGDAKRVSSITGMSMPMAAHYSKGANQPKLARETMAMIDKKDRKGN